MKMKIIFQTYSSFTLFGIPSWFIASERSLHLIDSNEAKSLIPPFYSIFISNRTSLLYITLKSSSNEGSFDSTFDKFGFGIASSNSIYGLLKSQLISSGK